MSALEERNYMLEENPDKFAGFYSKVFSIENISDSEIILSLKKDTLVSVASKNKINGLEFIKK